MRDEACWLFMMGVKADYEPKEVWRWQEAFSCLFVCIKSVRLLIGSAV